MYLYENNKLSYINEKIKFKYPVVGYIEEGSKKSDLVDIRNLKKIIKVKLVEIIKELNVSILKDSLDNYYLVNFNLSNIKKEENLIYFKGELVKETQEFYYNLAEKLGGKTLDEIDDEEILRNLVIVLSRKEMCKEAIYAYSKLSKKFPEESLVVAECMIKLGNELEALKIYSFFNPSKYKELEIRLKEKVNYLIEQFELTKNLKYLHDALHILPTYDAAALRLGIYYLEKKDYKNALKYLEEANRRNSDYKNLLALARAYLHIGEGNKALEIIEIAERIRRTPISAYLKALAYEILNSPKHAERDFLYACINGVIEACAKISPNLLSNSEFNPELLIGHTIYGYKIEKLLGTGGMGYVYLVEKDNRKYAMKIMKKDFNIYEMLREISKVQEISKGSDYIVRIFATFIDENWNGDYYSTPPSIIMEFMSGGSLQNLLIDSEYSSLRYSEKWKKIVALVFYMITEGLIHIHKNGYVHCDIKPPNILFNNQLPKLSEDAVRALTARSVVAKISDLGSAVKLGSPVIHYTPYYAHPLQRFGSYAEYQMDVYSFSVSLYVSLARNYPYPEWLENEIEKAVTNPQLRQDALKDFYSFEPRLDYIPVEFREIIRKGLKSEVTMEEIKYKLREIIANEYSLLVPSPLAQQNLNEIGL